MRGLARISASLAALALGCVSAPHPLRDRPAAYAEPAPDPALAQNVERTRLLATNVQQVSAGVPIEQGLTRVDVGAPQLSPTQAEEVRTAFADVPWRPSEGGGPTWVVDFGSPGKAPR